MLLVDSLLVGGIKFVLTKIASAVEAELNDEGALREELLAAQMRRELGEISDEDFAQLEAALLARLREIRARQGAAAPLSPSQGYRVTGVEADFLGGHAMGGDGEGDDEGATPPRRTR
jgi:hypothetical protein